MAVDAATVQHMARLARLDVPEDRVAPLSEELSAIVDHMAAIAAFDTQDEATQDSPSESPHRADTPQHRDDGPALVDRAAAHRDGEVIVPRVIDPK